MICENLRESAVHSEGPSESQEGGPDVEGACRGRETPCGGGLRFARSGSMSRAASPERAGGALSGRAPAAPPLDMGLLATLPSLPLRARYLVEGWLAGRHRSRLKGSSIEFAEYRSYQFGDEPRHVDWRLYARSDRLCVKVFEEETQLHVPLLLDASASMNYRSRPALLTKLDYARTVLAALAVLVQRQGDAAGVGFLAGQIRGYLRPRSSTAHLRDVIGRLDHPEMTTQTHLAEGLRYLAGMLRRRALVVIASDFYEDIGRLQSAIQRLRYDGHEVVALQVLDPIEIDFDAKEPGFFVDVESRAMAPLNPAEVRASYLAQFGEFQRGLSDMVRSLGGDLVTLRTDQPPVAALAAYLAHREHRT